MRLMSVGLASVLTLVPRRFKLVFSLAVLYYRSPRPNNGRPPSPTFLYFADRAGFFAHDRSAAFILVRYARTARGGLPLLKVRPPPCVHGFSFVAHNGAISRSGSPASITQMIHWPSRMTCKGRSASACVHKNKLNNEGRADINKQYFPHEQQFTIEKTISSKQRQKHLNLNMSYWVTASLKTTLSRTNRP